MLGATTVTAGLLALVYGIVKAQAFGWGSASTLGVLAGRRSRWWRCSSSIERRARGPLVRLAIFRDPVDLGGETW